MLVTSRNFEKKSRNSELFDPRGVVRGTWQVLGVDDEYLGGAHATEQILYGIFGHDRIKAVPPSLARSVAFKDCITPPTSRE